MSAKKDKDGSERFADLIDDVVPLPDAGPAQAPKARRPTPRSGTPNAQPRRKDFIQDTGEGSGRAEDTARSIVVELRQGAHRPQRELDLHGLRSDVARRSLEQGLASALAAQERCVLVIHGLGKRSADGPVLKRALPGWIDASALAPRIMAWAPAPPDLGGEGATLVLLRRSRAPRS